MAQNHSAAAVSPPEESPPPEAKRVRYVRVGRGKYVEEDLAGLSPSGRPDGRIGAGCEPLRVRREDEGEAATEAAAERDPSGAQPHEPGVKLDAGKPPVLCGALAFFPRALAEVARASELGARKYAWDGWQSVPDGAARYGDALVRHILAEYGQGPIDPDSGLRHAAHAAWNALARLELLLREDRK